MKKVKLTGVNINQLSVLSGQEMFSLFKKIKEGDGEARDKIVSGNLKLVLSVLQRFNQVNHSADDLFQVGCIGLIKAVNNFDTNKGVKFSTYAVPMILGEIRRYIRDNKEIKVSRSLRKIAYQTLKLREKLVKETGKEPTIEELAKSLEISREMIISSLEATKSPISLFTPIFEDEGEAVRIMDRLINQNRGVDWDEEISIRQAFNRLSSREQKVISSRFYEGKTQMEIADMLEVSQAQVSRIQKRALQILKNEIGIEGDNR